MDHRDSDQLSEASDSESDHCECDHNFTKTTTVAEDFEPFEPVSIYPPVQLNHIFQGTDQGPPSISVFLPHPSPSPMIGPRFDQPEMYFSAFSGPATLKPEGAFHVLPRRQGFLNTSDSFCSPPPLLLPPPPPPPPYNPPQPSISSPSSCIPLPQIAQHLDYQRLNAFHFKNYTPVPPLMSTAVPENRLGFTSSSSAHAVSGAMPICSCGRVKR